MKIDQKLRAKRHVNAYTETDVNERSSSSHVVSAAISVFASIQDSTPTRRSQCKPAKPMISTSNFYSNSMNLIILMKILRNFSILYGEDQNLLDRFSN